MKIPSYYLSLVPVDYIKTVSPDLPKGPPPLSIRLWISFSSSIGSLLIFLRGPLHCDPPVLKDGDTATVTTPFCPEEGRE